ncbi:MAG: hypothetical protein HRT71_13865 [Flavobacteriales bacterium]|nr:hypothetical protein [Flavobacteriales bacterium]
MKAIYFLGTIAACCSLLFTGCGESDGESEHGLNTSNTVPTTLFIVKDSKIIAAPKEQVWKTLMDFNLLPTYNSDVESVVFDTTTVELLGAIRYLQKIDGGLLTETVIAQSPLDSISFKVIPTANDTNPDLDSWYFNNRINTIKVSGRGDTSTIHFISTWTYRNENALHTEQIAVDNKEFFLSIANVHAGLRQLLEKKVKRRRRVIPIVPVIPIAIDTIIPVDTTDSIN